MVKKISNDPDDLFQGNVISSLHKYSNNSLNIEDRPYTCIDNRKEDGTDKLYFHFVFHPWPQGSRSNRDKNKIIVFFNAVSALNIYNIPCKEVVLTTDRIWGETHIILCHKNSLTTNGNLGQVTKISPLSGLKGKLLSNM